MRCNRRSRVLRGEACIDASSGTAYPVYQKSRATSRSARASCVILVSAFQRWRLEAASLLPASLGRRVIRMGLYVRAAVPLCRWQMQHAPPVLYSFRRCPYAMRGRMALIASGVAYHCLSPRARANCPPLETTAFRNERSVAPAHAGQSVQDARLAEERLRVPAELSHWPSWDAALLETIDALHEDLLSRCRARGTLGGGAARFADYETLT